MHVVTCCGGVRALEQLRSPVSTRVVSCQPVYSKGDGIMGSGFGAISQL